MAQQMTEEGKEYLDSEMEALKRASDEHWPPHWYDTGCPDGVHSSCLRCQELQCRFEDRPVGRPRKVAAK